MGADRDGAAQVSGARPRGRRPGLRASKKDKSRRGRAPRDGESRCGACLPDCPSQLRALVKPGEKLGRRRNRRWALGVPFAVAAACWQLDRPAGAPTPSSITATGSSLRGDR
jgi:hypothetical protein